VSGAGKNDPSVRRHVIMITSRYGISHSPVEPTATNELASLRLALAYIDSVREGTSSLGAKELSEALQRLHRAYQEFPELELDRPRRDLSKDLRSAVTSMPEREIIPLLADIAAFDPSCLSSIKLLLEKIAESDDWRSLLPILHRLISSRKIHWRALESIVTILRRGEKNINLPFFLELLKFLDLSEEETADNFGNIVIQLLSDQHPVGIHGGALAKAAPSAQRSPSQPSPGGDKQESRDALLAMAQRLRADPPPRSHPTPDLAWPSGRMSFDEFLTQWPCEVELPVDLDNHAFVEAAYQAILLRGPDVTEMNQYLELLQNGAVSKPWIIEDLLGSEELRFMERQLRVICGGYVITEPGRSVAETMPAVTWPWRPAT
jgi:hypothetical protein